MTPYAAKLCLGVNRGLVGTGPGISMYVFPVVVIGHSVVMCVIIRVKIIDQQQRDGVNACGLE